jgi:hypothetical protein
MRNPGSPVMDYWLDSFTGTTSDEFREATRANCRD